MTQQEIERLIDELESFAKAYPESVFGPVTDAEIRDFPNLITRNSAAMGRHMGKWMQRAADAIRALTAAPTVTDADLGEIARFAGTKNDAARLTHKLTTDAALKAHGYEARIYPAPKKPCICSDCGNEEGSPHSEHCLHHPGIVAGNWAPTDQQGSPPGKGEHDGGRLFKCTDAARRDVQGPASLVAGVTNFGAAAPPTEGAIPREANEAMLLAMHDGPLSGGDEVMGDEQCEWLREMWRAGYDAAPKATEGAAMKALRELVDAVDAFTVVLLNQHGMFITEELAIACNKANALLAIAPPTEQKP